MSLRHPLVLGGLILALFVPQLVAQGAPIHTSERHGFSVGYPAGWRVIPIRTGEKWILAKIQCDRSYALRSKEGMTSTHTPTLRVLVFPHEVEHVKVEKRGDTTVTRYQNPYRDYADYFKRNFQDGGYYVSAEEKQKIRGGDATYQEIKVEKLTNLPRRFLTMHYHLEDRDFVVEVDLLENHFQELAPKLRRVISSLRTFAPQGQGNEDLAEPPHGLVIVTSDEDLDEQIEEKRRAWRKRVLKEAEENLPPGWRKDKSSKHFLILWRGSHKYTAHIKNQAVQVRKWLDRNFKDVGKGKVMRTVIRVCADAQEERAYLSGSGDSYSWDSGEVVCSAGNWILSDFSRVAHALTLQYLGEKNPALWRALPPWLSSGLGAYVHSARISKIKGFIFVPPQQDFAHARKLVEKDWLIPVQDLITKDRDSLNAQRFEGEPDVDVLQRLLVRFLMSRAGSRGKTKGLITDYMKHAVESLEKHDRDAWRTLLNKKMEHQEPMTEEEEEQEFKRRLERAKEWDKAFADERRKILEDIYARAFADWSEKDWKKVDKAFRKFLLTGHRL